MWKYNWLNCCQLYVEKDHQSQRKSVNLLLLFLHRSTVVVVFFVLFLFFSPNPVKLFLRADQCSYASVVQLINETPLILLLSSLFISLLLLLILPYLLLCPLSLRFSPSPLPPFPNLPVSEPPPTGDDDQCYLLAELCFVPFWVFSHQENDKMFVYLKEAVIPENQHHLYFCKNQIVCCDD